MFTRDLPLPRWHTVQHSELQVLELASYFIKLHSCIFGPNFPGLLHLERCFTQGHENFNWFSIKDPVLTRGTEQPPSTTARAVPEEVHDLNPFRDHNITLKIYSSIAKINSACNPKIVFLASNKGAAKTKQHVSLLMQSTWQCLKRCQVKTIKGY